jgi:hypothetical protein
MGKYLIVLEIELDGFVIGIEPDFETAKLKAKELWDFMVVSDDKFSWKQKYSINPNEQFLENAELTSTNGFFSVHGISMDRIISIEAFILEREASKIQLKN